jgi:hypothetical protein
VIQEEESMFWKVTVSVRFIQGDSGERVNILRGDNIGHCEKKRKDVTDI